MESGSDPVLSPAARSAWLRLGTLIWLRWLAVFGQTAAVLVASLGLGVDLRLDLCALVIGASAVLNIAAGALNPSSTRLTERAAMLTILFDICQLGLLLALTGGLHNPFALLIVAPVTISATVLGLRPTVFLGGVAILIITALVFVSEPIVLGSGAVLALPPLLLVGTWAALVLGVVFLAAYARAVIEETFAMSQALAATQLALGREQKLTALGGMVAAAAHELGTPLATIKLVSSELADELADRPDLAEDIALIRAQADRCRDILRAMGRGGIEDEHLRVAPLLAVVEEAALPHAGRRARLITRVDGAPADEPSPNHPDIRRQPEIIHGLRNLIQNAVDFAETTVWIDIDWNVRFIRVTVGDDGPGFAPDQLGRLGEPFLRRRGAGLRDPRPGYDSMGLGLFIAKTLLERTGATLTFANGTEHPDRPRPPLGPPEFARPPGAIVEVAWPRPRIEAPRRAGPDPAGP